MQTIGLKTVATMTKKSLDALLSSFPSSAVINRTPIVITVTSPEGGKVLSAMHVRGGWHVMAMPGLVEAK